jgi:hypothetical protein
MTVFINYLIASYQQKHVNRYEKKIFQINSVINVCLKILMINIKLFFWINLNKIFRNIKYIIESLTMNHKYALFFIGLCE